MNDEAALFVRDGNLVVPTDIARGPWRKDALHGGAVGALLASGFDLPGRAAARITVELIGPVPTRPLRLLTSEVEGGSRVGRQTVTLLDGDAVVATASCVAMRLNDDLPPDPAEPVENPFAGVPVPGMDRPKTRSAELIGWSCFDSGAISIRGLHAADRVFRSTEIYFTLLASVIAGEPTKPLSRVAAAADYASTATSLQLPFETWSFMNAELTLHVARPPVGTWTGLLSSVVLGGRGAGFSTAPLFDESGRLGHAAQSLVVERRKRASA